MARVRRLSPLAKPVLTKRNTKSRNKLSKRNKMHIKKSRREFRRDGGAVSGHKKAPQGRGGEGGRIAVFEEAGPSVRLFS